MLLLNSPWHCIVCKS